MTCDIVFDIETGPLSLEQILAVSEPFEEPQPPGPFDPASVKCGNLGPEKAAEKIEAARAAHWKAASQFEQTKANAYDNYVADLLEKASLSALTGQVLAIGYQDAVTRWIECVCDVSEIDSPSGILGWESEKILLERFWHRVRSDSCGFNIADFDIPFLIQRSFVNAVDVPQRFLRRWLPDSMVDMRAVWNGPKQMKNGSLNAICKACGFGEKNGSGKDFAKLYATEDTRHQAFEYLFNDIDMHVGLARRMGLVAW